MDEPNGSGKSRLDRLEGLMELLVDEHVKFNDEHKRLLTAQVVLTDRVDKLAVTMQELAEAQSVLMHVMDEFIRGRGDRGPGES
jgi:hypothetical protein